MPSPKSQNERDPIEAMRRLGLGFIGVLIFLLSLGIAGGVVWQSLGDGLGAASLVGAFLSLLGFVAAAWMVRSSMRKSVTTPARSTLLESRGARGVLRVAKANAGQITVGEAALECRLSTEEARDILDAFYLEGVCEQQLSASGQEVYYFSDFLNGESFDGESVLSDEDEVALQFDALLSEASSAEESAEEPARETAQQNRH